MKRLATHWEKIVTLHVTIHAFIDEGLTCRLYEVLLYVSVMGR